MNTKDIYGNNCPTLYTLSLISGKWRMPIIWKLYQCKVLRFNELKKEVTGITNMMLTQCLQDFEKNQIIQRVQYDEIPPKVEYRLTPAGIELVEVLKVINTWGEKYQMK